MKRRTAGAGLALGLAFGPGLAPAASEDTPVGDRATAERRPVSVVVAWNAALLGAVKATGSGPTVTARALSMVHEATYNAWAAYDGVAMPTGGAALRRASRPPRDDFEASIAVCHAAYGVLVDLFPGRLSDFDATLAQTMPARLGSRPTWVAALQVGQAAAVALLQSRHGDGANQRGDLAPGPYADYTGYAPVNTPDLVVDPNRWQPLRVTNAQGVTAVQKCLTPHWGRVRPFALAHGAALRPPLHHTAPSPGEVAEVLRLSAGLTDEHKAIAEYWAGGPGTVTPPGMWSEIAALMSSRRRPSLARDVKTFFALGQAMLDASIAAWDAKRAHDSVRPITTLRLAHAGQQVQAWAGPGLGTRWIRGEDWQPYQPSTFPTPPFPEFVSGHSTFSAAAAEVLRALHGEQLELKVRVEAGASAIEPGLPRRALTLHWRSLGEAAAAAGLSRRYGGIHFEQGDLAGRALGREVGRRVMLKCRALFGEA